MMGDARRPDDGGARRDADGPAALGLDDLLRERLAMPSDDPSRTWADRVADALITAAAAGDVRSWSVLAKRVGAPPKAAAAPRATIDDETAGRILEAARGPVQARLFD